MGERTYTGTVIEKFKSAATKREYTLKGLYNATFTEIFMDVDFYDLHLDVYVDDIAVVSMSFTEAIDFDRASVEARASFRLAELSAVAIGRFEKIPFF